MSRLSRIRGPGFLVIFGASAASAATYRFLKPSHGDAPPLDPHDFAPYVLVDKEPVSSTSAIFTLSHRARAPLPDSVRDAWNRSIWSVQVKQPQLQIARAYTPLPACDADDEKDEEGEREIRLLIRQEAGGEVSTYLHRLPELSTVELRGPHVEHQIPDDVREVVFLAGGTGIAPAMQVAHALARRSDSKMHLLWANRRREECEGGVSDVSSTPTDAVESGGWVWWKRLLGFGQSSSPEALAGNTPRQREGVIVRELKALKEQSRGGTRGLHVRYYVDEEKSFIKPGDVLSLMHADPPETQGSRIVLISGPDGFIDYWAGKKLWVDGRETQGPLGGVLGSVDLKGWKVIKL